MVDETADISNKEQVTVIEMGCYRLRTSLVSIIHMDDIKAILADVVKDTLID